MEGNQPKHLLYRLLPVNLVMGNMGNTRSRHPMKNLPKRFLWKRLCKCGVDAVKCSEMDATKHSTLRQNVDIGEGTTDLSHASTIGREYIILIISREQ